MNFFGLSLKTSQQYRLNLYTQIHEIVRYGGGGYTDESVWKMPTWKRKFIYQKLIEEKEKKNNENNQNTVVSSDGKINKEIFKNNQNIPSTKNSKPIIAPKISPKYK